MTCTLVQIVCHTYYNDWRLTFGGEGSVITFVKGQESNPYEAGVITSLLSIFTTVKMRGLNKQTLNIKHQ